MAVVLNWGILGLLVLISLSQAWLSPPASDKKCVYITLKSTSKTPDKKAIKDKNGRPADIISVEVEKSLSRVKCELRDTIDIAEPFVIARKGCHAQLKVCYREINEPDPTVRPGCKLVRLLSRQNRDVEQTLDINIRFMRLVRQFPQGVKCELKENYGFKNKVAYAKKGCRGDFEVCTRDYSAGVDCDEVELHSTPSRRHVRRISDSRGKGVDIISMDLIKQISRIFRCVQGKTFQISHTSVIAQDGCHGKFRVCYKTKGTGAGCIKVRLLSTVSTPARKKISEDKDKNWSIRLLRQFSGLKCVKNQNYGTNGRNAFAEDGCRGEFEVCPE